MPSCYVCNTGHSKTQKEVDSDGVFTQLFYQFPKDPELYKKWIEEIGRQDFQPNANSRVCFKHFKDDDFKIKLDYQKRKKKVIKDSAVPLMDQVFSENRKKAQKKIPNKRLSSEDVVKVNEIKRRKLGSIENTMDQSEENRTHHNVNITIGITAIESEQCEEDSPLIHKLFEAVDTKAVTYPTQKWNHHVARNERNEIDEIAIIQTENSVHPEKAIIITPGANGCNCEVLIKGRSYKHHTLPEVIESASRLQILIEELELSRPCRGAFGSGNFHKNCDILMEQESKAVVCKHCKNQWRNEKKKSNLAARRTVVNKRLSLENYKLRKENKQFRETIESMHQDYEKLKLEAVEEKIALLPDEQQLMIRTCFTCAKAKTPDGRRYSKDWIYECILMRLKSPALYEHIRVKNIIPLPTAKVLRGYTEGLKAGYGFDEKTFEVLKKKIQYLDPIQCNGSLLMDEMKLTEGMKLNTNTLQIDGFVNLGNYTPQSQKSTLGDHGLVFMYQPFTAPWVQVVGCFLSKGNVTGDILSKLVLEAIFLLESVGLLVHCVICDGAKWNRTMMSKFGVERKGDGTINLIAAHPVNLGSAFPRKLYFVSDFPHLIKCVRNRITDLKVLETPDGIIDLKYWKYISDDDVDRAIKRCPFFLPWMVKPNNFQKQNVDAAFKFFSNTNATTMEVYMKDNDKRFNDAQPTINFIKKLDRLIDAMNNLSSFNALRVDSCAYDEISDFVTYLLAWENMELPQCRRISDMTLFGLRLTLENVLDMVEYLTENFEFQYLLTRRVNQDKLEHFFGLVRGSCGNCTHPDSIKFAQIVRLLSINSLIKPVNGSNVEGCELLENLLTKRDFFEKSKTLDARTKLSLQLDIIIEDSHNLELISSVVDEVEIAETVDKYAFSYLAGYVSRKASNWAGNCPDCIKSIRSEKCSDSELIDARQEKYDDHLLYPSEALKTMLLSVEKAIIVTTKDKPVSSDLIFEVAETLQQVHISETVGCAKEEHKQSLSLRILQFYIITRLHFFCKSAVSKNYKSKKHTKLSRLVS